METSTPKFTPGMLVALMETWPTKRIICLKVVKTVGKQQVRFESSDQFFTLDGKAMGKGPYRWRAIVPVTKAILEQAREAGVNTDRALGHIISD